MIPILFVSLLNGKMYKISNLSYFPEGKTIVMSVWVLDLRITPNFSTNLTKVI